MVPNSALVILACVGANACAPAGAREPYPDPELVAADDHDPPEELGIPAGHLPPPGECRVWYPDRPAGQQPPPGSCYAAEATAPPGTWVLFRPDREPSEVHARVIDRARPGVVILVHIFNVESGAYLRAGSP